MKNLIEVKVPDIGDFQDVPVIELLVAPGSRVRVDDALLTLESSKATMEVPSPAAGVVQNIAVKVGDNVSQGSVILTLEADEAAAPIETPVAAPAEPAFAPAVKAAVEPAPLAAAPAAAVSFAGVHASPSVRRFARELGVDLTRVTGTGPKRRILQQDVQNYVKAELAAPKSAAAIGIAEAPTVDFSKYGNIESRPLSRIKKLSGANLHRNWISIPHVTQFDEADITELEAFRKSLGDEAGKLGIKVTLLAFLMKASVAALKKFPEFNSSLGPDDTLVLKNYYHIGVAVETPDGLVVPVIRDVDQKSIFQLAAELGEASAKARAKKLMPGDMQGGCFSISSLGGVGGTAFTPIINAPEVAILGVSKSAMKPVYQHGAFVPRLMLPLSLSYDHRVIDGAMAARFTGYLAAVLSDIRRLVL